MLIPEHLQPLMPAFIEELRTKGFIELVPSVAREKGKSPQRGENLSSINALLQEISAQANASSSKRSSSDS
jgi:hypothetical protein